MLELSPEFAEFIRVRLRLISYTSRNADGCHVVHIPINHCGRIKFPEVVFPVKARIPLRLLVKIPKELRQYEFELFARQVYQGDGSDGLPGGWCRKGSRRISNPDFQQTDFNRGRAPISEAHCAACQSL